ncbi:uncharacterized protein LOC108045362 [Drosophila rhopaloa]|uniref:Uncharacterized protein LOC108045362 n=1 Tax=Drosophila rhopaloa TaxID=1041015 RepID=A0A6P4F487_DRORH|nr:uncharacterized protein LOC108045362 [Drosophila rhopaloa]
MIIEKQHPLDNCQLFVQMRRTFQDVGGSNKSLGSILYWSGNEEHIALVCDRVAGILLEHELIVQEPHAQRPEDLVARPVGPKAMNHLRGLLVYLVVNTANQQQGEHSQWSEHCFHLCGLLPAFPQFLTIAIALKSGLQQPLEEFLACGPRWLTSQYFDAFDQTLSHVHKDPLDALPLIFGVITAAARAMVYHNLPEANKKLMLQMSGILHHHLLTSEERLKREVPATMRGIYLARATKQLLELLVDILGDSKGRQLPKYFTIYSQMSVDISGSYAADTKKDMRLFAQALLDGLQRVLQPVSVYMYMFWLEIPSPRLLYSYQELVCCLAAEMLPLAQQHKDLSQHDVCKQLKTFADAAKSFEQRLTELTIGELLSFLDGDLGKATKEQLLAGLANLFGRSIAYGNDECVETMEKHLRLLTPLHAQMILAHLGNVVEAKKMTKDEEDVSIKMEQRDEEEETMNTSEDDSEEDEEEGEYASLLNLVLRPLFLQLSSKEKIHFLQTRDKLGVTTGDFKFEAPDHQERRVRFFNRLEINRTFPLDDFLALCYENPEKTWLDFAILGMAHQRFGTLFWRVARHCPNHAVHQMTHCARELLRNGELLIKANAPRFLLSLYGHRQILNGLHSSSRKYVVSLKHDACMYDKEQLKQSQSEFLEGCAGGLAVFSETLDYTSLQRILRLLFQMTEAEQQLQRFGRLQMRSILRKHGKPQGGEDGEPEIVQIAKQYQAMHELLPEWRQENIKLISQLMFTIDALRWNLTTFVQARVDALGLVVRYWLTNLPYLLLLTEEFRHKIVDLLTQIKHKDFWLLTLEEGNSSFNRRFISLVTQASGMEATKLFAHSLKSRIDSKLMGELSDAVVQANCQSALEAFKFLFRRYMVAFRHHIMYGKLNRRRRHWDHLMAVVTKTPLSIRNEIMTEARQGFYSPLSNSPARNPVQEQANPSPVELDSGELHF